MKKYIAAIILSIVAFPALADADLKQTFENYYSEMEKAMETNDTKGIKQMLTPDFVSVDAQGKKTDSTEMIQSINNLPHDNNRKSSTTVEQVDVKGDTALVIQSYNMKTVQPIDGKMSVVDFKAISHDTWIKSNGKWLVKETVTDSIDYTVDGKNIMHQGK